MAEISQTPDLDPPPPSSSPSPSTPQRTTKPGTKRLALTLSVLLSFLAGLPFLQKSTEIYRSPLPFASISSLSSSLHSHPPSFPFHLHAVFLRPRLSLSSPQSLSSSISRHLESRISSDRLSCGARNLTVSVTIDAGDGCESSGIGSGDDSWMCGAVDRHALIGNGDDDAVDELLDSRIVCGGRRVYTVVVVDKEEDRKEVQAVVGKHRHAWIIGQVSENDAVKMIGEIFVEFFVKGGREERKGTQGEGEFMPIGLDGSVILSLSLLNANPNDWVYDWDMQKVDKVILTPVVEALAPVANVHIESQVLYHTPKSSISYWDEKLGSYVLSTSDLPFFVNSNEWHLDTSIAAAGRAKVLQFVVYVPSAEECPLILRLPNGETSKTNGFISPMWGGVVVWNSPNCSRNSQMSELDRNIISPEDMQKILQVFIGQLRLLFGFKSDHLHVLKEHRFNFLASRRGFTEWELDTLYRYHACSNLLSCASTLDSLSKLVQSLPRMIVTDEIGKQVKLSLEAAGLAQNNASVGAYDASAVSSRKARALAEDAFFHPSIMSISYSSTEHYFAIYMPFFAPVTLHVLLAVIKEVKRYKREKAKYMQYVGSQKTTAS